MGQCEDINGNIYPTIKICDQEWMAENLRVTTYRNGDAIKHAPSPDEWRSLSIGAWCSYENLSENDLIFGKLYNFYAVIDPRGLAPHGWHVASDADWKKLEICLGMSPSDADKVGWRGSNEGEKLKQRPSKNPLVYTIDASNESGFSALFAGSRLGNGRYDGMGFESEFWTSTKYGSSGAWWRSLQNSTNEIFRSGNDNDLVVDEREQVNYLLYWNNNGFSVRCVRD